MSSSVLQAVEGVTAASIRALDAVLGVADAAEHAFDNLGVGSADAVQDSLNSLRRSIRQAKVSFDSSGHDAATLASQAAADDPMVALGGLLATLGVVLGQSQELHADVSAAMKRCNTAFKANKGAIMTALPAPEPEPVAPPPILATGGSSQRATPLTNSTPGGRHRSRRTPHSLGDSLARTRSFSGDLERLFPATTAAVSPLAHSHSIEDSVGPAVLGSRGTLFARSADLLSRPPAREYLVGGGAMTPADAFVPLLWESPSVAAKIISALVPIRGHDEIPSFSTTGRGGDHHKFNAGAPAQLPSTGWRTLQREDGEFATFFAIIAGGKDPSTYQLWIHDAAVTAAGGAGLKGRQCDILHCLAVADDGWGLRVTAYTLTDTDNTSSVRKTRRRATTDVAQSVADGIAEQYFSTLCEAFPPLMPPEPTDSADGESVADDSFVDASAVLGDGDDGKAPSGERRKRRGLASKTLGLGKSIIATPFTATKAVAGVATSAVRSQQEAAFRKAFPERKSEAVVDIWNCAWMEGALLKQGYLYATKRWLCFQATVMSAKFSLELEEVREFKKAKTAVVFDNAIDVVTVDGRSYFLTSFLQRDECHKVLYQLWVDSSA